MITLLTIAGIALTAGMLYCTAEAVLDLVADLIHGTEEAE